MTTYRAIWEIEDDSRPTSALIAEAAGSLDVMARADGARITGEPKWTVTGLRLVCEAPAEALPDYEPLTPAEARDRRDIEVLRLSGLGWTVTQITATTGVPPSTVRDVLRRNGRLSVVADEGSEAA